MHPDVLEKQTGSCPICKMSLVPVRLDTSWICPIHTTQMSAKPGMCPIDKRPLVQARVAVTWTCAAQQGIDRLEPGTCPDGSPTIERRTLRPHGNHNPQHGGQFFMAPDTWHHLEGTLPRDRLFRLHVYDDYARTLPAAALAAMDGRVVTPQGQEVKLKPSRDGRSLEATIARAALPAPLTVKVRLKPGAPEYRFDFTFRELTREPVAPRAPATQNAGRAAAPAAPAPASAAAPAADSPAPAYTVPTEPLPGTMAELIADLGKRRDDVRALVQKGDFGAIWVPAFQAKDLAVALEPHIGHLPLQSRAHAEPALSDVVRTAWQLDAVGDTGNADEVTKAFALFTDAVSRLLNAFSGTP